VISFFRNLHFKAPFPTERGKDELHFTYLDTVGRPVIVARKKNLVEGHIQDFKVQHVFLFRTHENFHKLHNMNADL
jgi:hypothetical protein